MNSFILLLSILMVFFCKDLKGTDIINSNEHEMEKTGILNDQIEELKKVSEYKFGQLNTLLFSMQENHKKEIDELRKSYSLLDRKGTDMMNTNEQLIEKFETFDKKIEDIFKIDEKQQIQLEAQGKLINQKNNENNVNVEALNKQMQELKKIYPDLKKEFEYKLEQLNSHFERLFSIQANNKNEMDEMKISYQNQKNRDMNELKYILETLINKQNNENKVKYEKQENNLNQVIKNQNVIVQNFRDQENKIKGLENQLKSNHERQENNINRLIPIGFLYTQLPRTAAPQQLWPQFKWSEVTEEYSGLFFRAEGDGSLPFGQIQSQNQSWISQVYVGGAYWDSWTGPHGYDYHTSLNQTKWIDTLSSISIHAYAISDFKFYTTGGEVRPKNTAIKIFKRIE